jgi:hypothetical protein
LPLCLLLSLQDFTGKKLPDMGLIVVSSLGERAELDLIFSLEKSEGILGTDLKFVIMCL